MVTTVPPLHVAILSIEKMLPSLADLPAFIRLLPRSATGQPITSYVSVITGPRKAGDATGAKELHIVLLDNGRTEILAGESRDILKCIRCGACMNVCPVYRTVGGHAYGWTYPGPMGLILTTLLTGMRKSHPLVDASTVCGACVEVCPVRVPLVDLILQLRRRKVREGFSDPKEMRGMALFGKAAASPTLFALGQRLARAFWPAVRAPGRERRGGEDAGARQDTLAPEDAVSGADRGRLFLENAAIAAAGVHSVSDTGELLAALARIVAIDSPVYCPGVTELEKAAAALFPSRMDDYAAAAVTVEEVFGAVAETGTIVCACAQGRAVQAGLFPAHHVAIVRRERIFDTLDDLFAAVAAPRPRT